MAASGMARTEDLGQIGELPVNNIIVKPLNSIPSVPPGGYLVSLQKSAPAKELRRALCEKLDVHSELLILAHEGRDLQDEQSMRENDIVEPGVAARKAGVRIELYFALSPGTEVGCARREREAKEAEAAERAARELAAAEVARARRREHAEAVWAMDNRVRRAQEAEAAERAARERASAANAGAPPAAPAGAVAAGNDAENAEMQRLQPPQPRQEDLRPAGNLQNARCRLRLVLMGTLEPVIIIETTLAAHVEEILADLHRQLGTTAEDALMVVNNGEVLELDMTLWEAGVRPDAELVYCFTAPEEGLQGPGMAVDAAA